MTATNNKPVAQYWAVVPAAGVGRRMGGDIPKQYLSIAGKTVLEHSVERLLACVEVQAVMVAIGENDGYFQDTGLASHERVLVTTGGAERYHSVQRALQALAGRAGQDDWVLVHDAARPCVSIGDIETMINYSKQPSAVGAVLGIPVRDTMKYTDSAEQVTMTIERTNLWHAHTPQMFRMAQLQQALQQAIEQGKPVTDEATAMELAGYVPKMIAGQASNLKITLQSDLKLAEFFLNQDNL
jgi:2-C-methyl-D-erythritol 4-phosphate cytidylyltransferase